METGKDKMHLPPFEKAIWVRVRIIQMALKVFINGQRGSQGRQVVFLQFRARTLPQSK